LHVDGRAGGMVFEILEIVESDVERVELFWVRIRIQYFLFTTGQLT
jgi:hypothetical protein